MALLVLAYPVISEVNLAWIQSYRKQHDISFEVVQPHFTIVFPTTIIDQRAFIEDIYEQSKGLPPIVFDINKAILNKDSLSDYYYEFLVPANGYSDIVKLHDKLYSGKLQHELRNDIEYIPHISIGKSKDLQIAEQRIAALKVPSITGQINHLAIVNYDNNKIRELADIKLSR